jgi:hypothetical protein
MTVPPPEMLIPGVYAVPFTGVPNVLVVLYAIMTGSFNPFFVQLRLIW